MNQISKNRRSNTDDFGSARKFWDYFNSGTSKEEGVSLNVRKDKV